MKAWLVLAAVLWPLALGAATAARVRDPDATWAAVVYVAASRVCHQRPDRSFHTAGVRWPVCGRCTGLYAAAPFGAVAAWAMRRRRRAGAWTRGLLLAAVPTIATLVLEWIVRAPMTNLWRCGSALPLGAAVAFVLVRVAPDRFGRPDTLTS